MSLHEIIPGTLWGAAGWLRPDARPPTWLPPGLPGWLPVNAYALRDGAEWMVVDTGLPAHWPELHAALAATLAGTTRRRMVNTRREQDCMANLHAMSRAFGIAEVPYVGVLNPLDLLEDIEAQEAKARIEAMAPVRAVRIAPDEVLEVGRLRLEPLRVTLRLLATNWFHEHVTGTLFTSDAFAGLTRPSPDAPILRGAEEPGPDPVILAHAMSAKFDWLTGIDPAPILADLDAVFAGRRVARICPGHGCVIEGEAAVARTLAAMREAIRLLAARPKPAWRWPDRIPDAILQEDA